MQFIHILARRQFIFDLMDCQNNWQLWVIPTIISEVWNFGFGDCSWRSKWKFFCSKLKVGFVSILYPFPSFLWFVLYLQNVVLSHMLLWWSKDRSKEGRRNSSVGNASDFWCVTHCWAAHHCVGGSNPNACERSLASHAIYMLIQCTPLLVEKAGVAPVVTFRITARKQESMQVRYPLWIWNPWGRTHKVQNRSNQWLHKMDLGPNKNF